MSETVRLEQVKRIEGHGRISLFVDDAGNVSDAHFDILEFRGFEQMLKDRMVWEMPLITSRICGVCPVSHHLAAVKAVDDLYDVTIPPAARMLRETMHLGGLIQDHALHFFFLAGPDFLTGDGSGSRDILGVIKGAPELALKAIGIRKTGQGIVETVGGRASHPVAAIPGGMSKGITIEQRDEMLGMVRGGMDDALMAAEVARESTMRLLEENPGYAVTPMPMMAITNPEGGLDFYDGDITVVEHGRVDFSSSGQSREFDDPHRREGRPQQLRQVAVPDLPRASPAHTVSVRWLASTSQRRCPGERSQELMELFRAELGRPVHATLAYHWARMIELVAGYERLEALLSDDEILSSHVRVQVNRGPGSGHRSDRKRRAAR